MLKEVDNGDSKRDICSGISNNPKDSNGKLDVVLKEINKIVNGYICIGIGNNRKESACLIIFI